MPRYRRNYPVTISRHVKPTVINPKKFAFNLEESADQVAFGSNVKRFHESHYYLEDGDPGANKLFSALAISG